MQIMVDTAIDTPKQLRLLAMFLDDYAAAHSGPIESPINEEAGTTINGPTEPVELKPDFKPSDSLPADKFETGVKLAPMIPPPPGFPLPPLIPAVPVAAAIVTPAATAPVLSTATSVPMIPPPPGVPAPGPEFDSKGVQWSAALHTSTKTKTIDGQWKPRTKRGANAVVPADTTAPHTDTMGKTSIQGVVIPAAQLPAALAAYTGAVPIPPPPMIAPPGADDEFEVEGDVALGVTFPEFIANVTAGMNAGTVTQARIAEVMAEFKLDSVFSLNAADGDVLAQVSKAFGF